MSNQNESLRHAFLKENPNYIIYNDGRLFSIKTGKFLTPNEYTDGYLQYHITLLDGTKVTRKIHRLVAEYFVYNRSPKKNTEVNHKDENKHNNHATNLEWCDRQYNANYSKTWVKGAFATSIHVAMCDPITQKIIATYNSIKEACRKNNLPSSANKHIRKYIDTNIEQYGFIWKEIKY